MAMSDLVVYNKIKLMREGDSIGRYSHNRVWH